MDLCELLLAAGATGAGADGSGSTPLHYAAGCGHAVLCRRIIDAGGAVDAIDVAGLTPLHCAASSLKEPLEATIHELLAAGAAIDARDHHGRTPLATAARMGRMQTCLVLLDAGADLEARDADGATPLMLAADALRSASPSGPAAHRATLRLLIAEGALAPPMPFFDASLVHPARALLARARDPAARQRLRRREWRRRFALLATAHARLALEQAYARRFPGEPPLAPRGTRRTRAPSS